MTSSHLPVWSPDLTTRLCTIVIGLPLLLLVIFLGTPFSDVTIGAIALLVSVEFSVMIQPQWRLRLWLPLIATLLALLLTIHHQTGWLWVPAALVVGVGFVESWCAAGNRFLHWVSVYWHLAGGILYISIPMSFLIIIRNEGSLAWMIFLLFITWMTDTWALLGGRFWGRHKLAPTISPGKTIEGAVTGYIAGVIMGGIIMLAAGLPPMALLAAFLIPFLVICGDLVESWLKRYFDIKDSGSLLPGHGGFFDRVDGLLLATPVLYFLMMLNGIL